MYNGSIRRIRINGTPNRMGLIFLVLKAISDYGINIVTMESDPYICCKLEWNDSISEDDFLNFMRTRVPEIESISYIDLMEYERIEIELSTLLNNVDCAIIKCDIEGNVLTFNEKGKELLNGGKSSIVTLQDLLKEQCPELKKMFEPASIEFMLETKGKEKSLFAELNPIKNEQDILTGFFVIVKEMANIRHLINTIIGPSVVSFGSILGESKVMKKTIAMAQSVARSEAFVMIRGESGTGKELFARAIHLESTRAKGPFITVNCASIPESLMESEFFGYDKGAFTGASANGRQGYFEQATGGTLFLDEIGELAPHLQAKLLRALQEKCIRRVGGKNEIDIDVRVITATHRNLEQMIEEKTFREDLYYRLNIIPLFIPPLREREGDIELITNFFVHDICSKNGMRIKEVTNRAMEKLLSYSWPGNVRQLNNVLERAVFMANEKVDEEDIIFDSRCESRNLSAGSKKNDDVLFPVDLPKIMSDIEMRYINKALEEFPSFRVAAKNLNISHTSIINKTKGKTCK